jgi:hypothetical protein
LLEWAKGTDGKPFEETLEGFIDRLEAENPNRGDVNLFEAAKIGSIKGRCRASICGVA